MKTILMITLLSVWTCSAIAQDSLSVLFIGNSYTYVNDLPQMTRQLAESLGKELTVGSKTNGGYTFQNHWNDPQTYNALHQRSWDVVVLQAQSQEPSFPAAQVAANTLPFAERLSDSVYANNACGEVLYFMTWGRENGDPQWDSINTFDKMNQRLYNAYMHFAQVTDGMVSPVGAVWNYVRDHHPAIQLYSGDGSHPSAAGSYLAACTFYATLFRESTAGAGYWGGLDAQTAGILQQAADLVVLDSLEHFRIFPVDEHEQALFDVELNGSEAHFNNNSLHATAYEWQFGDGGQSTAEHPSHQYAPNTTYTVTLIVHGDCGSDTTTRQLAVGTTGSIDLAAGITVLEFEDHFVINSPKPLYYEIYSFDGKKTASGKILTADTDVIKKVINVGFLFITDDLGFVYRKSFYGTIK